ncbi:ion channel [Spirillospora sp. NPDC047279]|uniref:potassium channel family protein n=1 Tax=Spirillospora sp. NPDC047279 TaxID=3155478 RepID=UPI0033FABC6E
MTGDDRRTLGRWEQATQWPLMVAAALFFAAYAVPVLDPDLSRDQRRFWVAVTLATWLVFIADYAVRLRLAPDRRAFLRRHLLDVFVLALPLLRPLTLVRALHSLPWLRRGLEGRAMAYAFLATLILGITASLAVLSAERGAPGANIATFGDAVWWTATTVTSVGYGDTYPVTVRGRAVGVALMFGGVALVGVVTASFASWFVSHVPRRE